MAAFDVERALRWARFRPRRTLPRREDPDLPFVSEDRIGGQALLLDTCVYIDHLQDRAPDILRSLIAARQVNHAMVAIQELMHTIGTLDPRDRRTMGAVDAIRGVIRSMPAHRVFSADADILGRAALLSGIVCRLQGYGAERRLRALHDCVLFLQAQKLGLTVLTADIGDFDVLLRLVPTGRVLFYRR